MTRRFVIVLALSIGLAIFAQVPRARSQMSLGTVAAPTLLVGGCPSRSFAQNNQSVGMVCYSSTIQGCPNADDLTFVYGVAPPVATKPPLGTVVYFSGGGGNVAEDGPDQDALLVGYINDGYQLVEIAWGYL